MGAFKVPLLATGIAFALGTILNLLLRRRNRAFAANMVLAIDDSGACCMRRIKGW